MYGLDIEVIFGEYDIISNVFVVALFNVYTITIVARLFANKYEEEHRLLHFLCNL